MWKSAVYCWGTITFFPQVNVQKKKLFHRSEIFMGKENLSPKNLSTFHNPLWINYRQELMFAVMSRM